MNVTDNMQKRGRPAAGSSPSALRGIAPPAARLAAQSARKFELSATEIERFLRVVSRASGVRSHYELFQLLQGDVQFFMPHEVLICAWGDFRGPNLMLDVVSALPGVRTSLVEACPIGDTLGKLHSDWLSAGREAMQLGSAAFADRLVAAGCDCALHRSLRSLRTAVVHGSHDARDDSYRLYLAAGASPVLVDDDLARFRFLVDSVLSQVEIAFRRVGGLRLPGGAGAREQNAPAPAGALSVREQEILVWVSEGRTNREISQILSLSEFTVKNHMQRILRKLDVANRAEAVARYPRRGESRGGWHFRSASALPLAE